MKAIVQSYNNESGKMVLQTCIPFVELKKIAKFSYRRYSDEDPYALEQKSYQRTLNLQHIREIKQYIMESLGKGVNNMAPLFPTSMLIAINSDICLKENEDFCEFELPDECYVVDGQHRLKAMMEVYDFLDKNLFVLQERKQVLDCYKFNCTILLNFDLWEQARIFADVNFKQKRVNKSLYYDIYGSFYSENSNNYRQNHIYIAHSLVAYLNSNEKSPLKGRIRMLGNGKGTISQAFLVEALLPHLSSPNGIWYFDPFETIAGKELFLSIKTEVFSYFHIVETELMDMWNSTESIICKTTGMGALIRLMGYIHKKQSPSVIESLKHEHTNFLSKQYTDAITPYFSDIKKKQEELFSSKENKGNFNGTGGKGLEMKLYKALVELIEN